MFAIFRRVILFILVNALVVISISIVLNLLGIQPYLTNNGIDPVTLAIFCVIWGSAGSLISLLMSKKMALWQGNIKLIDPNTQDPESKKVLSMVYELSKKAGLPDMPEVGVYQSPELNAFATGPTKSSSLVAISTGLLQKMDSSEVDAVVGHEVSHVGNGDMVTMTLLQGVVNAFVMFLSRLIAYGIRGNDGRMGGGSFALISVLQIVFMFFGSILVFAFSRWRELRADVGGAKLAGRQNMINALKVLQKNSKIVDPKLAEASFRNLKISIPGSIGGLFASHPSIEERIKRLEEMPEIR